MAPKLRSDGRRRRRIREWAAPFIVTVALSPACTKAGDKAEEQRPPQPQPAAADAATAQTKPPPDPPPDPPPGTGVFSPPPDWTYLGDIRKDATGCVLSFHVVCDPGEKCNPPKPQAVPCPDFLAENQSGHALMKPDKSCEFWPPDGCPKVKPGDPIPPCNPPPPVAIKCP
jgi:hypothetical protein